jgi:hypothetical protein
MRPLILTTIVAATAATLLPTPSFAQTTPFCIAGRGCVPATQESYNGCFQLALRRGLTVSRGDLNNLNSFIYQCLQGRIPR